MPSILETYERRHARSRELFQQALTVFPGGVTHDTRYATPFPIFVERAAGSRKWDVDGNEIIDYVSGHGALLLGHSRPEIVAAVIVEPTGAHMGKLPIEPDFLRELREICTRAGVVLIFDEVVTGFRASLGGVQAKYNVTPDLTTLAKILAGGLPGGAVAGRAELLNRIAHTDDPDWNRTERVEHPGTFNANPLSAAAGRACLAIVAQGEANEIADRRAHSLGLGMNEVLSAAGVAGCVYGAATILHVLLGQDCLRPEDGMTWRWQDESRRFIPAMKPAVTVALKRALINEGVDLMSDGRLLVGAAHTERDIQETVAAFRRAVTQMQAERLL